MNKGFKGTLYPIILEATSIFTHLSEASHETLEISGPQSNHNSLRISEILDMSIENDEWEDALRTYLMTTNGIDELTHDEQIQGTKLSRISRMGQ